MPQKAQFSHSYTLIVEHVPDHDWTVRIEGPKPITEHREMLMSLLDAQSCAHALGVWHFQQKGITEKYIELDKLVWQ